MNWFSRLRLLWGAQQRIKTPADAGSLKLTPKSEAERFGVSTLAELSPEELEDVIDADPPPQKPFEIVRSRGSGLSRDHASA